MSDTLTHALSAVIDECNHDLFEQETACADGFCPICATIKLIERSGLIYEAKDKIVQLERELAEVKEQLRLCNVDQFTTAAELAEATVKESLIAQRPWVGLTDREFQPMIQKAMAYYGYDQSEPSHLTAGAGFRVFANAIEAKLREKNT